MKSSMSSATFCSGSTWEAQTALQKEQFVYDYLSSNQARWESLSDDQRYNAHWYINMMGGLF